MVGSIFSVSNPHKFLWIPKKCIGPILIQLLTDVFYFYLNFELSPSVLNPDSLRPINFDLKDLDPMISILDLDPKRWKFLLQNK